MGDAFHQIAVAAKAVGVVIDNVETGPVINRSQMLLRHRHAHGHRESLTERSGGHFHAVGIAVFGMSRCLRSILPKLFEVRDREVVPGQVQHAIEHRGSMPVREHKAVAIGPLRVLRIVPHVFVKEEINHRRIAQRRTGVPAICLFHRVDGKKPQGVNRQLIEFAHKSSSLLFGFCLGGQSGLEVKSRCDADFLSAWLDDANGPAVSQEGGSIATSKLRPSHRFSSGQNRVKESAPVCSVVVGRSA